jgi:pSer/pThr/pTyr-binding forkhead associated (FHA) protein
MAAASESSGRSAHRAVPPGARVCVLRGFYEGLELEIDQPWLVIGRGSGADWMLAELTLSRAHAAFGWDGESFFVEDLGSTNGTFVNGVRTTRARLREGDEVAIGKLALRLQIPASRSMATPQPVS